MDTVNEIGNRYGKLVVTERDPRSTRYGVYWKCQCDCGGVRIILGTYLRQSRTTSCGCNRGFYSGPKRKSTENVLKTHFTSYKVSKRAKELGFDLTLDTFESICRENCYYCGSAPQERRVAYRSDQKGELYAYDNLSGLDRIDSTKGYHLNNLRPCCGTCNLMKNNKSDEEFLEHIKKIYNHLS